jgi:hypothetical protein
MDYDTNLMRIKTVMEIKKGDELFINYNAISDDDSPIWFKAN